MTVYRFCFVTTGQSEKKLHLSFPYKIKVLIIKEAWLYTVKSKPKMFLKDTVPTCEMFHFPK